jgi:hypothetical protein
VYKKFYFAASTVHPYVSKARHMLGDKCPVPKIVLSATAPVGIVAGNGMTANGPDPVQMGLSMVRLFFAD